MFPPVFGQLARVGGTRGLVISVIVVLLLANFVDLSAIASLGSAVALAIFLITSIAAYRLRAETGSRTSLLLAGILLTIVVLLVFAVQTLANGTSDVRREHHRHSCSCHRPGPCLEPYSRPADCRGLTHAVFSSAVLASRGAARRLSQNVLPECRRNECCGRHPTPLVA